jgi:signal transduction histidine kinase
MFDAGSSQKMRKSPPFLLFIIGVALIFSFAVLETIMFYRSMNFHRHLDAEGNLRFVISRVKGHLEILRFTPDLPPYLKSLDWLNDELREHPLLYGVLIRKGNNDVVNTFPAGFGLSKEDTYSCENGIARDTAYILCRTVEVLPGENLFFAVVVDTTQQLRIFYRLVLLSFAIGISIVVLFYFAWLQLKRMMEKEDELLRRLSASEKLAVTGKLAAMIAHEIRNPLNALSIAVQYMRETGEVSQDMMEILSTETAKLKELSEELFGMQRDFSLGIEEFSVLEMIMELENKFIPKASAQGITFICESLREDIRMRGNKKWLLRALENIIRNAFESVSPASGIIKLRVKSEVSRVVFSVEDNGCGISDDDKSMIFEPFYTTKDYGFGLGLYIVQKVVEAHGGFVNVESSKNKGTVFTLVIPSGENGNGSKKESQYSHR